MNQRNQTRLHLATTKKQVLKGLAIGAGITATVAGAIYLVKSGKGKQIVDKIKKSFKKDSKLSMQKMKANYKTATQMDAHYLGNNPKYYSGEVIAKAKNGNETLLTYKNGAIQKAITKDPAGKTILEKEFLGRMRAGGTDYVPSITKKADGKVLVSAFGNYENASKAGYPKFFLKPNGEVETFGVKMEDEFWKSIKQLKIR